MTLDAAANPSHAGFGTNPALTAGLAIAGVAAATLAGAWFFQLVLDIRPCPLCLEQRYAYYLALPLGLLVAFVASKEAPRPVLLAGLTLLLLAALANAWLGTYHAGVEWKFWQGPTDCTGPVGNLGSAGSLRLFSAIMQVAVNVLARGCGVEEAIDRPRVYKDAEAVHCEGGTPVEEMDRLEQLGYAVTRWRRQNLFFGGVAAVELRPDGMLAAAGDPRRGGHGIVVGA